MHDTGFDHLAQAMGAGVSRRGMLRALAGGGLTLGLLGWTAVPEAAAKSCKKIKDKQKRKKCLKKAKGTTDQLPAPPPPPVTCPSGTFALAGRCAPNCGETCTAKGGTCLTSFDGAGFCFPNITSCAAVPNTCSSHTACAAQELCAVVACGPNGTAANRCVPFLV